MIMKNYGNGFGIGLIYGILGLVFDTYRCLFSNGYKNCFIYGHMRIALGYQLTRVNLSQTQLKLSRAAWPEPTKFAEMIRDISSSTMYLFVLHDSLVSNTR